MNAAGLIRRSSTATLLSVATVLMMGAPAEAAVPLPTNDPTHVSLADLRPRISAARNDRARVYGDGCHVAQPVTSALHCVYGVRTGTRVVVVIGDSIMAQWWAAVHGAARSGGWRVVWMTKSACPAADVTLRRSDRSRYTACDSWRRNALTKVRNLPRVDLLLMGGSSSSTLLRRGSWTVISDPAQRQAEWQAGYRRTVDRVAGQVRRAVILRDTPAFPFSVPSCLAGRGGWTRNCSRATSAALSVRPWQAEVAVDARYSWVRATDLSSKICQPMLCWPVTSNRILRYRDGHHLTNTYAAAMAPAMYSRLRWLMR
jgi:hypothetical protein